MVEIELKSTRERDIDLFLIEELCSSLEFCAWFQSRIEITPIGHLRRACHSVNVFEGKGYGETDVDLTFDSPDGLVRVLVENKVDARFTLGQDERYRQRQICYEDTDEFSRVLTVLFAPKDYIDGLAGDKADFDYKVSYEEVVCWLESANYPKGRLQYKRTILERAIEKKKSTGEPTVVDMIVTEFRQKY
ncbi:MAG: hypothetical protein V3V10_00490 [Planctomycetota bacterium]